MMPKELTDKADEVARALITRYGSQLTQIRVNGRWIAYSIDHKVKLIYPISPSAADFDAGMTTVPMAVWLANNIDTILYELYSLERESAYKVLCGALGAINDSLL